MNRIQTLLAADGLALQVFDHPAHEPHEDPDTETASGWGLAFVRAGQFSISIDGRRSRLRPGSLFLTYPGLRFQCRHRAGCLDDVCVSIAFSDTAVTGYEDAWMARPQPARERPTPRLAFVQGRLESALASADVFNTERWAIAALDALAADSARSSVRGKYAPRCDDLDAVVATCRAIDADPVARLSVAERSRVVCRTGTQLTHAFRRYLGVSPHQYVLRRRLAAAAALLDEGRSVSEACYRAGFENLSHFVRSFQRAFALRASQWRSLSIAERRRKVQDLLRGRS